jgi:hypothetical protein
LNVVDEGISRSLEPRKEATITQNISIFIR